MAALLKSDVEALAKALSDPTRLSIYLEIVGRKELYVGELTACHRITKSTVSHHLHLLTQVGLIESRRCGQHIFYRSVPARLIGYYRYLCNLIEPAIPMAPVVPACIEEKRT